MSLAIRALTALTLTAIVVAGAGPSCSSGGSGYSTTFRYSDPYRDPVGPGLGCARIPTPSQC